MTQVAGKTALAALMVTASTYITYGLGLIVSALIARDIGPEDFGRYSYTVMLVGVLVVVANHGLTTSAIRFISQCEGSGDLDDAKNVHGWLKRGQWLSICIVATVLLSSVEWLKPTGWAATSLVFVTLVTICLVSKGMFLFNVSIAKGYRKFNVEATANFAVGIATAVAVVIMFSLHSSLMNYLLVFAVSSVAYWLYTTRMLRTMQMKPHNGVVGPELMNSLQAHLVWTMVLTLVGAFSNKSIEIYLLNLLTGPAEVGYFTIAVALTRGGVELLSSGLTTVLMPLLAHAYGAGGNARVAMLLPRTVRYFHFMGLFIAGVGTFLAKPVVIFMYGSQYEPVINILQILMLTSGLTLSSGAFGALLSITDHQRARAGFAGFTLIVNIVAAVALIPKLGLAGAVMAQAISRFLSFFAMVIAAKSIMPLRLEIKLLWNLTLSAIIASLFAGSVYFQLPGMFADIIATMVFAIVYFGLSVYLRTWKLEDVQLLISIMGRLPGKFQFLITPLTRWKQSLDKK